MYISLYLAEAIRKINNKTYSNKKPLQLNARAFFIAEWPIL